MISKLTSRPCRKIDTTPFDRYKIPPKQNLFLMPLIFLACKICTLGTGLKISKTNMKGLKPPFLVFCTHHSFTDFYVTPLALAPYRANYVSELEGFEAFGEWIYRQAGCAGTRKFVNDIALIKNIKRCLDRKGIFVIYPEARYANVGTSSEIPLSVGKMVKKFGVPVVTINMHGNYLQSPIWNTKKRRVARLSAEVTGLLTPENIAAMSPSEITEKISAALSYDEYKWQADNNMEITFQDRAKGLHLPLYRCPLCNTDFSTDSEKDRIFCKSCGAEFRMDTLGQLSSDNSAFRFTHIPDWYEWERSCVKREIDEGLYSFDMTVHIEALPNEKNFIDCGEGRLVHNEKGFFLTFKDCGDSEEKTLHFSSKTMVSLHTEYNYREKWGECITLSTLDNTYFLFPGEEGFSSTKLQFATEYFYKLSVNKS